ncbi:MAG TPA: hypothetical protein VH418_13530 [Solirubrobacteraceae bacterium]|jgi:hypothetical protein
MGDHVVQLACDPRALLERRVGHVALAVALEPGGALAQQLDQRLPLAQPPSDPDRRRPPDQDRQRVADGRAAHGEDDRVGRHERGEEDEPGAQAAGVGVQPEREARDHAGGERLERRLMRAVVEGARPRGLDHEHRREREDRVRAPDDERQADRDEERGVRGARPLVTRAAVVGEHLRRADRDQRDGGRPVEQSAARSR